jgi:hypothetical protein
MGGPMKKQPGNAFKSLYSPFKTKVFLRKRVHKRSKNKADPYNSRSSK